jgi:hypothetical protein
VIGFHHRRGRGVAALGAGGELVGNGEDEGHARRVYLFGGVWLEGVVTISAGGFVGPSQHLYEVAIKRAS